MLHDNIYIYEDCGISLRVALIVKPNKSKNRRKYFGVLSMNGDNFKVI
jgi:hypothetical protein